MRSVGVWVRVLAVVGAIGLPTVWLGSLAFAGEDWITNLARVVGAAAAAVLYLATRRRGQGVPWAALVFVGIIGSLLTTGVSALVPPLGVWTAAGWLVSGAVGGAMVGLVLRAQPQPGGESPVG